MARGLAGTFRTGAAALVAALALLALPAAAQAPATDPVLERVDFRDLPLSEASRLLSDQAGMNIVPSGDAGKVRVSMFLRDVPALVAVETLCRAHDLWFQRDAKSGIVRIHTVAEYRRDLVSFQREETEYFTLLYPNAADVGYAIRNLYGNRVVLRFGSGDDDLIDDLENRLDRFDVMDERTQGFGLETVAGGATGATSGAGGDTTAGRTSRSGRTARSEEGSGGNGVLPGQDGSAPERRTSPGMTSEEITDLERILAGADADQREALLEALARRSQSPIRVSVLRRQNKVVVRTSDAEALEQVRILVRRLDVPTSMVLLEVRVLSIDISDGFSSFFEYQFANNDVAGAMTLGGIANPVPPSLTLGGAGLKAGEFTFQFVNDTFAARMQLLQTRNRVSVLATPLLLTANNEVSRLFVGREVPLNRSFTAGQVVVNEDSTTTVPGSTTIEFRPVGTTLLMTPTINSDRTVTLRIVQESSDVNSTATVLVPNESGFTPQELNVVSSQTVSGTIVARSELAVAFGGLVEKTSARSTSQVPILGDVPVLGYLFKRVSDKDSRREIIIVVRPYVLSTPAESEAISHRLIDKLGVDPLEADLHAGHDDRDHRNRRPATPGRVPFKFHGLDAEDR